MSDVLRDTIGKALQENPGIIENILRQCTYRQLCQRSRVCKSWRRYATAIAGRRVKIRHHLGWKSQQRGGGGRKKLADNPNLKDFFTNLQAEVRSALLFVNVPSSRLPGELTALREARLPPHCQLYAAQAPGVIGTQAAGGCCEVQNARRDCVSAFLLPAHLPKGIEVRHFSISDKQYAQLVGPKGQSFAKQRLSRNELYGKIGLQSDKPLKALVLLSSMSAAEDDLCAALRRHSPFALCGGVAKSVVAEPPLLPDSPLSLIGIAFLGDSRLVASSIIVEQDDDTEPLVLSKLKQLSAAVTEQQSGRGCLQSFGFMFSCVERGKCLHGVRDVETRLFSEVFPRTPLAGMFCLGEFGWDTTTAENVQSGSENGEEEHLSVSHVVTSVFMVVSFLDSIAGAS